MVKLRLRRRGRRRRPIYDIVAADSRSPRDGRFVERVGQYDPLVSNASPVTMLDRSRALYWLQTGAQPTRTVRSLLSQEGIMLELHMNRKGAEPDAIAQALEQHLSNRARRYESAAEEKPKAAKEEAPAEEAPAAEAPAAEAPAAEAEAAPAAEATAEETPATEAPAEEAPAAEETSSDEAPAAEEKSE